MLRGRSCGRGSRPGVVVVAGVDAQDVVVLLDLPVVHSVQELQVEDVVDGQAHGVQAEALGAHFFVAPALPDPGRVRGGEDDGHPPVPGLDALVGRLLELHEVQHALGRRRRGVGPQPGPAPLPGEVLLVPGLHGRSCPRRGGWLTRNCRKSRSLTGSAGATPCGARRSPGRGRYSGTRSDRWRGPRPGSSPGPAAGCARSAWCSR